MKKLTLLVLIILVAGCGEAVKTENAVRERDANMEAAAAKMVVTRDTDVPGHPHTVQLGKVRGHCLQNPEANDIIPTGDNLRQAAYRKYGSQVDAIVDANIFHVNDDYSPAAGGTQGHFECEGTAVHFADIK
jgi:hypothetical protein